MKNIFLITLFSLFLAACGGTNDTGGTNGTNDTGDTGDTNTGVFIDAPVKGLTYKAIPSGETGTTNAAGEFEYVAGDSVVFSMGTLELGAGKPDGDAKIKITQLPNALLIAQLLQTLDIDASEDGIDVSGIVIPAAIITAILDKLSANSNNDIISVAELDSIKDDNTEVHIPALEIVTGAEVIAHITAQITGQDVVPFTEEKLNNHFIISSSVLHGFEGVIARFDEGSDVRWIDGDDEDPLSLYSKLPWSVDDGKVNIDFGDENGECTLTKLAEDTASFDISYSCLDGDAGIERFLKAQPFSVVNLVGKTITVENGTEGDDGDESFNITFNANGTFDSTDEEDADMTQSYEDSRFTNTVWLSFDDSTSAGILFVLAEGTISDGTLVGIEYDANNNFDIVITMKINGLVWTLEHDFGGDNDSEGSDDNI
jgi:hypothetical protein